MVLIPMVNFWYKYLSRTTCPFLSRTTGSSRVLLHIFRSIVVFPAFRLPMIRTRKRLSSIGTPRSSRERGGSVEPPLSSGVLRASIDDGSEGIAEAMKRWLRSVIDGRLVAVSRRDGSVTPLV